MTYKRFEDLPVWQAAAMYERTEELFEHPQAQIRFSFRDQLERAALSV